MNTSDRYPIPAAPARTETRVGNSRFIGSTSHTPTVDAARAFIAQIRAEFPDARHHTYAYLVGHGATVTAGMSDDGEPPGTAGRPMLAVLRGSSLGDITVVVTRYFGGTLLGTGGLVRAYSDATKAVLEIVPRIERVATCTLEVRVAYGDYAPARQALENAEATIEHEEFAASITLRVSLPAAHYDTCAAVLAEITAGQAAITLKESP